MTTLPFFPPEVFPTDWYTVPEETSMRPRLTSGQTVLLCESDRLSGAEGARERIQPGSVLYVHEDEDRSYLADCGWHKDFYATPPPSHGWVYGTRTIPLTPLGDDQPVVGDLIVRRDGGVVQVGILYEYESVWLNVLTYRPSNANQPGSVLRSASREAWLRDIGTIWHVSSTRTSHHPLTKRESETMTTTTPPVNDVTNTAAVPDTLCKDPAHEAIVVQMKEKDDTITGLRSQLAAAQRLHRADIERIGEAFWQEAADRRWCDDAIEFIESVNESLSVDISIPEKTYRVSVTAYGETTVTVIDNGLSVDVQVEWQATGDIEVGARTEDQAIERVEEDDDLVAESLSHFTLSVQGISGDAEEDDGDMLVDYLESNVSAYDINSVSTSGANEV